MRRFRQRPPLVTALRGIKYLGFEICLCATLGVISHDARIAMENTSTHRLVNERKAAERLGIKVCTIRRWHWSGDGPPFIKVGAAVRYDVVDLEAFIDAGRRTSTSDRGEAA